MCSWLTFIIYSYNLADLVYVVCIEEQSYLMSPTIFSSLFSRTLKLSVILVFERLFEHNIYQIFGYMCTQRTPRFRGLTLFWWHQERFKERSFLLLFWIFSNFRAFEQPLNINGFHKKFMGNVFILNCTWSELRISKVEFV